MAAALAIGGFFHFAVMWRKVSQINFVAASLLGKSPMLRMALRTLLCRLSFALVVYRIVRTEVANAKNGITRSQCGCQLSVTVGKHRPHSPFSNAPSARSAASAW